MWDPRLDHRLYSSIGPLRRRQAAMTSEGRPGPSGEMSSRCRSRVGPGDCDRTAQTEGLDRDNPAIDNAARGRGAPESTRGVGRGRTRFSRSPGQRREDRHGGVHPGPGLVVAILVSRRPLDGWAGSPAPRPRGLRSTLVVYSRRCAPTLCAHGSAVLPPAQSQRQIAAMSANHHGAGSAHRNAHYFMMADRAPLAIQTIVMSDRRCVGPVSLPLEAAPARRTAPPARAFTRPRVDGCRPTAWGSRR